MTAGTCHVSRICIYLLVNRSSCHSYVLLVADWRGPFRGMLWLEPYCQLPTSCYVQACSGLVAHACLVSLFNPTCILDVLEFSWDLASGVDAVGSPSQRSAPLSAPPLQSAACWGLPGRVFGFFIVMSRHLHGSSGFGTVGGVHPGVGGLIGGLIGDKNWWCTACKGLFLSW